VHILVAALDGRQQIVAVVSLQPLLMFHLAAHSASSTATSSEPEAAWPSPR
jgi:hypothetical protein